MLPLQQKSNNISNILKVKMTMEKKQSVIGIGEALFDVLPEGKKLGGAPANFAYHVSQFGLNSCAVSAMGDDELGKELEKELNDHHLNYQIEKVAYPTGTVQVSLDANGTFLATTSRREQPGTTSPTRQPWRSWQRTAPQPVSVRWLSATRFHATPSTASSITCRRKKESSKSSISISVKASIPRRLSLRASNDATFSRSTTRN